MRDFDDLVDFSGVACGVNYDGGGHVSARDDGSDRTRMVNACLVRDTVSNARIFAQRTGGQPYQNWRLRRIVQTLAGRAESGRRLAWRSAAKEPKCASPLLSCTHSAPYGSFLSGRIDRTDRHEPRFTMRPFADIAVTKICELSG
jgi:hypothetical protein